MKSLVFLVVFLGNLLFGASDVLECSAGWGRNDPMISIPPDRINDGYCDCPLTGIDETETGACSGSEQWPGIIRDAIM